MQTIATLCIKKIISPWNQILEGPLLSNISQNVNFPILSGKSQNIIKHPLNTVVKDSHKIQPYIGFWKNQKVCLGKELWRQELLSSMGSGFTRQPLLSKGPNESYAEETWGWK